VTRPPSRRRPVPHVHLLRRQPEGNIEIMSSSPTGIAVQGNHLLDHAKASTRTCATRARAPRSALPVTGPGAASTPPRPPWPCFPSGRNGDRDQPGDLRIDVMRSGGPAVRASTRPTRRCASRISPRGSSCTARTRRASTRTKAKALKILRARLFEAEEERKHADRAQARKSQIGSGTVRRRSAPTTFPEPGDRSPRQPHAVQAGR